MMGGGVTQWAVVVMPLWFKMTMVIGIYGAMGYGGSGLTMTAVLRWLGLGWGRGGGFMKVAVVVVVRR